MCLEMHGGGIKDINKFMDNQTHRWVAVVYDGGDKIGSHMFHGDLEDTVRVEAKEWVTERFGKKADWSLHHIYEKDG